MKDQGEGLGIAIFARAPVAGTAKTRLIPLLGAERVAALHAALVRKTLASAISATLGEVTLWCAPDTAHPFFEKCRTELKVKLATQAPGDLGERMLGAFKAQRGPLLLAGSDCPSLLPSHFRRCAEALRSGADAVFLPAEDGGYVLIGLKRPVASLFAGIEWSTERVMEETRVRLRAAALSWSELDTLWDVDRPEDAVRLLEHDPQEWTPFLRQYRSG
ncbi:MAG: TIGR04282 family arsenosugar biosynthesis glycosyltransferase [Hyphomicrobiales bacterium]|nr:TIGR04282 family arsenosugar biosynthesis glycosyltransferase [Hyphomicrobiales bacterium]MBV9112286.1 TIGR04282 family arsenosugar biosynthesis glycosyltransferase [Hyphomicrobiales bacterium]